MRNLRRGAQGWVDAFHPLPTLAVTVFATAYALAAQNGLSLSGFGWAVSVGLAILAGQLCVGWSNDAFDAPRDLRAQRDDKPISSGRISVRVVAASACCAAAAAVLLSWRLPHDAGFLHLIAVLSAISYNAGLKSTVLSPLPYLVSFGLLPAIASLAVTGSVPTTSTIGAAALLGAGAHFANTVGDTEADALTGVRGLPQRIGPARSLTVMAVLIALAAAWLLVGVVGAGGVGVIREVTAGVLLLGGVLLGLAGALGRSLVLRGDAAFRLTLLAVSFVVAGVLVTA
ncbi:UbiA family prenyltransferase [Kineosporia succinea]|uniref:4-hydroxybenzoate polyprenyltransferase n=1 Tax=Kineosporia succinea TaxID=84632 RepID=A0ABT9NXI3_9ACTN|nr:UbiA family prenyltransferase [Kineosporia succinea]MDP9825143.1 4-hydroxybenzoate polyprenyltransferase [Kineosporia succinea]